MRERIIHALDLAAVGEIDDARALLNSCDDPLAERVEALLRERQDGERRHERGLAVIRHELGNALSIALANVEGIVDGVLSPTPERLNGIRDALAACGVLLDDLKREQFDGDAAVELVVSEFDICESIAAQVSMLKGLASSKNVRIEYEPCGLQLAACSRFAGDPARVGQVLRNVLLNAVRYTPPGGAVRVICCRPDGELLLTIGDDGPGIAQDELDRIFEHGFRGQRTAQTSGDGVGLAVVSKLLQAFGGSARVVAQQDRGTVFALKLPDIEPA